MRATHFHGTDRLMADAFNNATVHITATKLVVRVLKVVVRVLKAVRINIVFKGRMQRVLSYGGLKKRRFDIAAFFCPQCPLKLRLEYLISIASNDLISCIGAFLVNQSN